MPEEYRMIDVSNKKPTERIATASGRIIVGKKAFELIKNKQLPKGDPLSLAETAGILSAKSAPSTIPLCHPLPLDKVTVSTVLEPDTASIQVRCSAKAFAKTGVEMEALAAVNGALLAIYDLTKQVEPSLQITDILLEEKIGGKSGHWKHGSPEKNLNSKSDFRIFEGLEFSLITMSDRAFNGEYEDLSGKALKQSILNRGGQIAGQCILPDDSTKLESTVIDLIEKKTQIIITTGGTGCGPRDITPEVLEKIFTKKIPGIGEALRNSGASKTPFSYLSRSTGGICNESLLIALPGSTKAMEESIDCLEKIIPHIVHTISGGQHG